MANPWDNDPVVSGGVPGGWSETTATTAVTPSQPLDRYQAAAADQYKRDVAAGIAPPTGYTQRLLQGASLGWGDELAAGLETPIQMIRRGTFNPAEGYRYAKAYQDVLQRETEKNTEGLGGTAMEMAGGLGTGGAGVLGSGTRAVSPVVNYFKNVGVAGGLGAFGGAGKAETVADIPVDAAIGGGLGLTLGAAVPGVVGTAKALARPLVGRFRNADQVALEQVAETMRHANVSPQQMVQEITDANAAGVPLTLADTLGKAGERKLSVIAKVPGEQRDVITDILTARALDRPNRIAPQLAEELGVQGTAQQAQARLLNEAQTASRPLYDRAMQRNTYSERLQEFLDDPVAQQALAAGVAKQRLEAVGRGVPFNPTHAALDVDGNIIAVPNMRTLQTLKVGIDSMLESSAAQNPRTGGLNDYGRSLNEFRRGLVRELSSLNPDYAAANRAYGGPMRVREAVEAGQEMAGPTGRAADNLTAFRELPPTDQQGVRIGYVDRLARDLERTGNIPGGLRAKSPKGTQELEALSLRQGPQRPDEPGQFRRFMNREEQMQRLERSALGGSPTFENLADAGGLPGGVPEALGGMVMSAVHGNPSGFVRSGYEAAARALKGETEAQRAAIARALLINEPRAAADLARRLEAYDLRRRGVNPLINRPPRYAPTYTTP